MKPFEGSERRERILDKEELCTLVSNCFFVQLLLWQLYDRLQTSSRVGIFIFELLDFSVNLEKRVGDSN